MVKPGRPGAGNSKKKGATKGTGGLGRKSLEGRGPTPKAEDR
ncbi:MAG: 23S rRNA (guanosine(2251)-2'-O)-methyltransferase RlmB, partial [Microbacterium sp.]